MQWFSGQALLSEIISAMLRGTKVKSSNYVLIKDMTMYDAELLKHAGQQACRLFRRSLVGLYWQQGCCPAEHKAVVEDQGEASYP